MTKPTTPDPKPKRARILTEFDIAKQAAREIDVLDKRIKRHLDAANKAAEELRGLRAKLTEPVKRIIDASRPTARDNDE